MSTPECPFSGISPDAWADAHDAALSRLPEGVEPTLAHVEWELDRMAEAPREEDAFDARNERRSA